MLTLSNIKIGKPQTPTQWSNQLQTNVKIDYIQSFCDTIKRANHKLDHHEHYDKHNTRLQSITLADHTLPATLPAASHYHTNYLNYLEKCWADHLGIVISPDIIWYTILCEFASLVKQNPETYKHLFTTSIEKQDIIIISSSLTTIPLDILTTAIRKKAPTDTDSFFPPFNFTPNSQHAFLSAFCDTCSPYYNYDMLLCGFPIIDVKSTLDDWKLLIHYWSKLKLLIQHPSWTSSIDNTLNQIPTNLHNKSFWTEMFKLKRCGSGHQTELSGWITTLFITQPDVTYIENFSSHISTVKYKQLDTNKHYEMSTGLFTSTLINDCMEPSFSYIVHDTTKESI